jgi:hypothetical protein
LRIFIYRKKETDVEDPKVEWYGKKAKKSTPIVGDPVICYIVGGTCYAEVDK